MRINKLLILLTLISLFSPLHAASKSDQAKEKRWEEQIVPSLLVGDPVKLKAAGVEFLGIYAEHTTDKAKGGIILMHGIGVHPAWPDVIDPVRMAMPDYGWQTLSIQMPILANDKENKDYIPLFPEVPGRIQAAVDFYKKQGIKNIVLIAHSLGVTMTNFYMGSKPDPAVRAVISVSSGPGYPDDKNMDSLTHFKNIKVPYFDIYGSQDIDPVLKTAPIRAAHAKKSGNKNYEQKRVEGANHFYNGMQEDLIKLIRGWLIRNAKGIEISK